MTSKLDSIVNHRIFSFRAIEFYRDSGGIPLSEALKKQHAESGFSYRGSFRFHRCCLLWLTCQKEGMFR